MTTARWLTGGVLIVLALVLGLSVLPHAESAATPGETPVSDVSEQRLERHLVEPALRRAIEANREKVPAELALPSGLPEKGLPQATPQSVDSGPKVQATGLDSPQPALSLADGVTIQEEIDLLVALYSTKYGVDPSVLRDLARCESTDNPGANGKEGERGLAQFLRSTWETTPLEAFGWDAAYHPAINLEAAAWMLREGRIEEFHALRSCSR